MTFIHHCAFQVALVVKNPPDNSEDIKRLGFDPWVGQIPWRRAVSTHSSILAWRIPMDGILAGYSPQGHKELDGTEATQHTRMHVSTFILS